MVNGGHGCTYNNMDAPDAGHFRKNEKGLLFLTGGELTALFAFLPISRHRTVTQPHHLLTTFRGLDEIYYRFRNAH